jgi:uncharacterized protein YjbJ (UPF0337 family)
MIMKSLLIGFGLHWVGSGEKEHMMNKDIFEGKWKQIRGQTTKWWGLMGSHDLEKIDKADVKYDKYVTMLQVKYGYTRDQARKEINRRFVEFEAEQKLTDAPAVK